MLDPVTIVIAFVISHVAGTAALVGVWAINPQVPGIQRWVVGRVLVALGLAMLLARLELPFAPTMILAALLIAGGVLVGVTGSRQFMSRPPLAAWASWGLMLAYGAALYWLVAVDNNLALRTILSSLVMAAISFMNVVSLWPGPHHAVRISNRIMAGIFAFNGLFFLVRAIYSAGLVSSTQMAEPSWDVNLVMLEGILITVLAAMTYTTMVTEYLQADLRRQAERDPLTGIHNRRAFDARARQAIERARRSGDLVALLYLDLDHFKSINDRFGHPAGDEVLRRVADIVGASLRKTDLSARLGGEEFAVLLPRTDAGAAWVIAERIRHGMEEFSFDLEGESVRATLSIGVAVFDGTGDDLERLSQRADQALYRAKQEGRNRTVADAA
ncbi:MAG: GGDEF domain-containing protein [Sneathiellaceae bacterium]